MSKQKKRLLLIVLIIVILLLFLIFREHIAAAVESIFRPIGPDGLPDDYEIHYR